MKILKHSSRKQKLLRFKLKKIKLKLNKILKIIQNLKP